MATSKKRNPKLGRTYSSESFSPKAEAKAEKKADKAAEKAAKKASKVEAATTTENWQPTPDMGAIQPPADAGLLCTCEHRKDMHYGGKKGWCNTSNCRCEEFVAPN